MHGNPLVQGYMSLLGFLATINPSPPASFTTSAALNTIAAGTTVTVVKQRTTFPATIDALTERYSQALHARQLVSESRFNA